MSNIRTAKLEEIRKMQERGELYSTRADAEPVELPDGFWDDAVLVEPRSKKELISIRLDPDIVEHFRAEGAGYQSRINAVLRAYVDNVKPD